MSAPLYAVLTQYLDSLDGVQGEFRGLLEEQDRALAARDADRFAQLAELRTHLEGRLRTMVDARQRILATAARQGIEARSLREIVDRLEARGHSRPAELSPERFAEAEASLNETRRASWVQWVVSQRMAETVHDIVEHLMHQGRTAVVYEPGARRPGRQALLLDASI